MAAGFRLIDVRRYWQMDGKIGIYSKCFDMMDNWCFVKWFHVP